VFTDNFKERLTEGRGKREEERGKREAGRGKGEEGGRGVGLGDVVTS
jgi:hypothetical protein